MIQPCTCYIYVLYFFIHVLVTSHDDRHAYEWMYILAMYTLWYVITVLDEYERERYLACILIDHLYEPCMLSCEKYQPCNFVAFINWSSWFIGLGVKHALR